MGFQGLVDEEKHPVALHKNALPPRANSACWLSSLLLVESRQVIFLVSSPALEGVFCPNEDSLKGWTTYQDRRLAFQSVHSEINANFDELTSRSSILGLVLHRWLRSPNRLTMLSCDCLGSLVIHGFCGSEFTSSSGRRKIRRQTSTSDRREISTLRCRACCGGVRFPRREHPSGSS